MSKMSDLSGKKIAIICNSLPYFFEHKATLFRNMPSGLDKILLAGEWAPTLTDPDFSDIRPIPVRRYKTIALGDLVALWRILALLKAEAPDILVGITLKANILTTLAASLDRWLRGGSSRVIIVMPGLGRVFGSRKGSPLLRLRFFAVVSLLKLLTLTSGTRLIFENNQDRFAFIRLGIAKKECTKVINGTGIAIPATNPEKARDGPLRVVFASRMLKAKGAALLIDAVRHLHNADRISVDILGGADAKETDALTIDPSDLPSQITYHGHVPPDTVREKLKTAHVVCLPTIYREGLPRILLEGATHECALIATSIAGCRAILKDGENGRMILARKPTQIRDQLVTILEALANDRDYVIALGKAAKQTVINGGFSEDSVRSDFQNFVLETT